MSLIARILEIIKEPIDCISPLPGGCINQVYSVKFKNGRQIVAKVGDTNSRFLVEEFMLNYLRENTILPVPNIYYSDNNLILMEFLGSCKALNTRTEREIADLIASLHNISADNFGFEKETLIGGLVQPNPISKNWRTFFRDQRLIYMADNAYQKGLLPLKSRQLIDKLCDNLERWISEPEAPSLIHGDLWNGNILSSKGYLKGFINPAIYFANAEIELSFSTLFHTFDNHFFSRYKEHREIKPGFFEERKDIYNLYPLLVHIRLFGGYYVSQLNQVLLKFVG